MKNRNKVKKIKINEKNKIKNLTKINKKINK